MLQVSKFYGIIGAVLLGTFLLTSITVNATETLSPPITYSKNEIIQKWKTLDENRYSIKNPFQEEPSIKYPYKAGSINQAYIEQGVKTANFYRYLSGLPMNLTAVEELNQISQQTAVLTAKNRYLDHYPVKPNDMPTTFYNNAYFGASTSNLAMFSWRSNINMLSASVDLYMEDSGVPSVGHRMWILSPYISSIGFGMAKDERQIGYSAMNVFGDSGFSSGNSNSPYTYFSFPGNGFYPKEYFKSDFVWSIGIDSKRIFLGNPKRVKITLKRKSDDKEWSFTHTYDEQQMLKGNYFCLYSGVGKMWTIAFRPDNLGYIKEGEEFTVTVSGIRDSFSEKEYSISHKTTFFDLEADRAYGRLINETTKKPLSGEKVSFYRVTSSGKSLYKTITTNSDGEFVFTGFPIGEYEIIYQKSGDTYILMFQIENDEDRFDYNLGDFEVNPYPEDTEEPIISGITNKTVTINSNFDPLYGVTAKDNVDGNLTSGIKVTGTVNTKKKGTYTLTYTVTDKSGNTATVKRKITVIDNIKPVISGATNKSIAINSKFDSKTGVTAKDNVDGNLTSGIKVTGTVNTKKKGTYTLTYTVTDKSGNTATVKRKITVNDNVKPVISGATNKSITINSKFDSKTGVTATDNVDGNLTSGIKVTGTVNTKKKGTYTLTYTVTDKSGNKATVKRKITVVDKVKPVISGASNKTIKINSKFNPKSGVTAKDNVDGNLTSSIKVSGTVNTKKKGTYTLTYTVTDKSGNTATVKRKITIK